MDENQKEKKASQNIQPGVPTLYTRLNEHLKNGSLFVDFKLKMPPLSGLQNSYSKKQPQNQDSFFLSKPQFLEKWGIAPQVAVDIKKSASIALLEIDGMEFIKNNHGEETVQKLEVELKSTLSELKSPFRFIGKCEEGSYIVASIGKDAEMIASIEFLRRVIEKKIFSIPLSNGKTTYLRITMSAGIASSDSQKTLDPNTLFKFAEYALQKAQTKGINSVQAA